MIIDVPEDLLGRGEEAEHLPDGHLEVHLRELEQALEDARHLQAAARRREAAAAVVARGSSRRCVGVLDIEARLPGGVLGGAHA